MRIKKYVAKSMREALLQIKEELGEDAVILKTRKLPKKVFSIGEQDDVEVTAAIDEETASVKSAAIQPIKVENRNESTGVYQRPRTSCIVDMDRLDAPDVKAWTPPKLETIAKKENKINDESNRESLQILELKENLKELRELVKTAIVNNTVTTQQSVSENGTILYKKLIDSEVREDLATACLKKLGEVNSGVNGAEIEKKLLTYISTEFPVSGPLKLKKKGPLIVAFVGPTGSGKTTTLAKLAAHCAINKGKSVSIITADTYRIAAIEQIRIFADIVKVGLQVVFSADEIENALAQCVHNDIVFIDTAGRSQRNSDHMDELKVLLSELQPDETHLVLSATTKYSDLKDIVSRYEQMGVNRLLFTKLDETLKIGNIYNTVKDFNIPLSYLTFGQSVPDDIELAQHNRFVNRLLEGAVS